MIPMINKNVCYCNAVHAFMTKQIKTDQLNNNSVNLSIEQ